ncbi:GntR family transcriptional regulator [Mesorhizobium sp. PAMC28654]|uniref:GntR family transcriptional regulator n=1 Tax=Mesorhizobium sp. PAMC28654 TaxID=2880934 RepID=UPI001D0B3705|nr:GntR family transcriptional regulator [Mesorhizobium sp. PAMC28654]UDL91884.1 GntR family transcriptional regulator [Mesorhizobium sp. PAMC28654]
MSLDMIDQPISAGSASPLQIDLARRILERIRDSGWAVGTRISVPDLARAFGVSRSPISAALELLVARGILTGFGTRGLQLALDVAELDPQVILPSSPLEDLYRRMMKDRAVGELPQDVSEAELMPRYQVSRGVIRKLLLRFAAEGLAQRLPGHGWRFAESLVGDDAQRESYEFRIVVECAALRSPMFRADLQQLAQVRRAHERILSTVLEGRPLTGGDEWFRINASFHEGLAACSGNRFLADAVRQQNNLRRLQESAGFDQLPTERLERSCREHLAILDAVEAGEIEWAEALLRQHLRQASEFASPARTA